MRKWILSAASGLALALILAVIVWQTSGQNPGGKTGKDSSLPITQVMFFNSGVSYFEREGEVDGNVRIDLSFPTSDINDLLKSLVLEDRGGGKISTVNFDSHDPIEKVLRSFSLDLNNNPSFSQILNQARGEKIELTRQGTDGKATKQTGTIVGVEVRKRPSGKDAVIDMDFLNITGDSGMQSISLDQVQSIRFLNQVIDNEFQRALRVVASSHDTQKKMVSLGFTGTGKRKVKVGYVVEQPIWKSSYRLMIEGDDKIHIQGWAIVENTSDDDWNNVRMVLVSGRPISFKMDLYEPLYIPRPTVEPELFASLRPPVYSGALKEGKGKSIAKLHDAMQKDMAKKLADSDEELSKKAEPKAGEAKEAKQQAKDDQKDAIESLEKAKVLNFKQGIDSFASSSELGEYYQIVIDQKITLPRQKSSMLPVLNQSITGSKLSIYNEATHVKYPLLGLRLKNNSKFPLNQGPITIYEEGSYAGDTRILDLQANEERLMSYALDQAVEIKTDVKSFPGPDMNFRLGENYLVASYKMREIKTYTIKNRAQKARTVLLEHPIRGAWQLADPKLPVETTRDVYRFQVKVPADTTVTFAVVEDQDRAEHLNQQSNQPQQVSGTSVNVKVLTHADEEKLLGLRIKKGFMTTTTKARETKTYFIQNLSEEDRSFTVDHITRDGWFRVDDQGDARRGPEIFRFTLKVAHDKTGERKIVEERTFEAKAGLVKDQSDEHLHGYLASPALSGDVKAGLTKALTLRGKIGEVRKNLNDVEGQLKELSADQTRLRENLKIIPQSTDPYKKFLDKFVAQESDIEALQKQIRQLQITLTARQQEYDTFVAALTVE